MIDPQIPFAHKRVTGQLQKGDGIYDETLQKFVKVKKAYPFVGLTRLFAIRKCAVEQLQVPGTEEPLNLDE